MVKEYVEQREGAYYIAGSRVSQGSVVHAFLRGKSPEDIAESFPAISLEQVFGAVTFYLANREMIDRYLQEEKAEFARVKRLGGIILRFTPGWRLPAGPRRSQPDDAAFSSGRGFQREDRSRCPASEPAVHFQSAELGGMIGVPDADVLVRAAGFGRVLVSQDRRTILAHFVPL
jgi:uncharacterized protein (DUF433 family)